MVEGAVSGHGLEAEIQLRRSDTFGVNVALSISPGETVALLGPNGAGKSTTLAALAGLLPIDAGSIALDGVVLDNPDAGIFVAAEERRVGVVFQDYLLFPHLSAVENVAFGLRSRGVSRQEALVTSEGWLARLGLHRLRESGPGSLSGGQAQRVALARALATEPRLLLLDEPMSALDVTTRTELRRALGEHLAEFNGPRLLITHDPIEALLLADRIQIMEHGSITQTGSGDDILLHPQTPYAADLAGSNLIRGMARDGAIDVGDHSLHVADEIPDGPVLVTIHPNAVSVHTRRPEGSPRNTWPTTVERIEQLGTRARLQTGAPLPLTVEVTAAAGKELGLVPGSEIWVAVKATEIGLQSDGGEAGGHQRSG